MQHTERRGLLGIPASRGQKKTRILLGKGWTRRRAVPVGGKPICSEEKPLGA